MGDFIVDLGSVAERQQSMRLAGEFLKYTSRTRVRQLEFPNCSLALASVDQDELWSPCLGFCDGKKVSVALSGRIALDEEEWQAAARFPAEGGLACRAICRAYIESGLDGLSFLNGNYTVFISDEATGKLFVVTDRAGLMPVYFNDDFLRRPVLSSHPDLLAAACGQSMAWDFTSLAQFLMTGSVTSPFSYYTGVRLAPFGCINAISRGVRPFGAESIKYYDFAPDFSAQASEEDLAAEFADALVRAVKIRSLPRFGPTGVALSGGLDSRAILAAALPGANIRPFSLYDEINAEVLIARQIAETLGSELILIQRDAEYYARTAELGVRISGACGSLASNHFLGVAETLVERGFQNLLTGCYCDYLFKALAQNVSESKFLRRQQQDRFSFEFYRRHFPIAAPYDEAVNSRLRDRFPEHAFSHLDPEVWHGVESRRLFPLAFEGDCLQRLVPQRVLPWYPLVVDTALLNVYRRTPPQAKLNTALFKRMMKRVCPPEILRIEDANTGTPVNAGIPSLVFGRYKSAILERWHKARRNGAATRGSWPNREYFIRNSEILRSLWERPNDAATDVLSRIAGPLFRRDLLEYRGGETQLFWRLLTLKIWLDQRVLAKSETFSPLP